MNRVTQGRPAAEPPGKPPLRAMGFPGSGRSLGVSHREAYRIYHRRWQAEHRLMLTYLPRALRTIEELCRP
jgi:hypothetical protein